MTQDRLPLRAGSAAIALLAIAACSTVDPDLRGATGAFSTAPAAQQALAARPDPDARGIISYPNYQVAVAQRGDTVQDVAQRIGTNATDLARFNGLPVDTPLRTGEVVVLPGPVSDAGTGGTAIATAPISNGGVDVTALAGQAIAAAPAAPSTPAAAPAPETGQEPIRHRVARGETAYTIARRYGVPVRSLATWNGLSDNFAIREGQILLIPVAVGTPPPATPPAQTAPGQGSPTPTPPSAATALPDDNTPSAATPVPEAPKPDLGPQTKPTPGGRFALPVQGSVIREYTKGRNEGIDIKGEPGGPVRAAEAGTVAAITESGEGVPIIVVRHRDNLLTVYANVTDVLVSKGEQVRRGQGLARLRPGEQSFVHFEVREGFDSVDPNLYLN